MEIVTVTRIKLNRIGSASRMGGGFGGSAGKRLELLAETTDSEPETLRLSIIRTAEENGEAPGSLDGLQYIRGYEGASRHIFNIQGTNVFYGEPYAECEPYTALKCGERYFRLDEILVGN